jgi:hypothetical protein
MESSRRPDVIKGLETFRELIGHYQIVSLRFQYQRLW